MSTKRKLAFVYLIIIHVSLVVILAKTDFISRVISRIGFENNASELTPYFYTMLTHHKWMDGSVPIGAIIIIGDSITQGLAVSAVSANSVNFGIGSDTTVGVLERLPDYKSLSRARAIILAIGVNDLRRRSNDAIVNNYKKILNQLPINIPIIASAILPIDEEIKNKRGLNNNRISALNIAIRSLGESHKNVYFANPTKQLIDSDNNLLDLYHVGDGVHLNTRGYDVWIRELRKALENT